MTNRNHEEGALRMPAIEGAIDAHQEDAFQDFIAVVAFTLQTRDLALHWLTSVGLA